MFISSLHVSSDHQEKNIMFCNCIHKHQTDLLSCLASIAVVNIHAMITASIVYIIIPTAKQPVFYGNILNDGGLKQV